MREQCIIGVIVDYGSTEQPLLERKIAAVHHLHIWETQKRILGTDGITYLDLGSNLVD